MLACCVFKRHEAEAVRIVRAIARYILLSWVLCIRVMCREIRIKFPTLISMQEEGIYEFVD